MDTKEQILQMVKEGTLSVEEGVKLLQAMETPIEVIDNKNIISKGTGKFLRVLVDSAEGDRVRVNIPLSLVKAGVNLSQQFKINGVDMDMHGVDIDMIMKAVEDGELGEIVNVDSANGDVVRVFVD